MSNRIERILKSIRDNAGIDIHKRVIEACGESDVKAILDQLESTCEETIVAQIMTPCGRQCIPESYIKRAKTIYSKAESIEDFLDLLNGTRIGGGNLHIKDGKIIGTYDKCYCGLANKVKDLSPLFCYCSAGWYEQLFSSVLDKPVEVKNLQTILGGADKCEFEINYQG